MITLNDLRAEHESSKKYVLNLLDKTIEEFNSGKFDESAAKAFYNQITSLERTKKLYIDAHITEPNYWVLVKSHPIVFKNLLLELYEDSESSYQDNKFMEQLAEFHEIALDILKTTFKKYKSFSGITNNTLDIRGKSAKNLAFMGYDGQDFLLDYLKNGNENEQFCSLVGLRASLGMSTFTNSKGKIIESISNNLGNQYPSVRNFCLEILTASESVTINEINGSLEDQDIEVRTTAVHSLFQIGINKETAKSLAIALEDSRIEITNLVLIKLKFNKIDYFEPSKDWINLDELDHIVKVLLDELVVRSSGRPKEIFNARIVSSALESLFSFNSQLQSKTLYQLCEIAFSYKGSTRNRAIFVASIIDKGEYAALVKEKAEENPRDTKSILEIAGASLDTSSIATRISETDPSDIQQNAANQIKMLEKYHEDGLQQAKTSFKWALILSITGMLFLLFTLYLLITRENTSIGNIITAISSFFTQFLAVTLFYLYNQTRKQLTYYHQQMNQIQKYLLANSVAESLEGEARERSRMELVKLIATTNLELDGKNN